MGECVIATPIETTSQGPNVTSGQQALEAGRGRMIETSVGLV
jgi:hypothetical protein